MLIDSHCHLDFTEFDVDREAVIKRCQALGINDIVIPGVKADSWSNLLSLCNSHSGLWPALGMHPVFMAYHQPKHIDLLEQMAKQHDIVAIGEIGLDFYIENPNKTGQIDLFEQQLALAKQLALPVILHVRKAHDQVISLLNRYALPGGIVHAFSGSQQQAQQYLSLGFLLGVGGVITKPNAQRLRDLFAELPLKSLVLETDAPDMPLYGHYGERNSPDSIASINNLLAKLRQTGSEVIASTTSDNVRRLLSM